jgi:Mg2+-importing ATPase
VVRLFVGAIVPADLRLLSATGLRCDESMLTGESAAVTKDPDPLPGPAPVTDLTCCALMGTVVTAGTATGIVVATGGAAEFGRIALGLGTGAPETDFQIGLRKFSLLLMQVAAVLCTLILITNVALHRRLIDAVLFALAIAVGITPQLLPAVVSTSLAAGSRRLAAVKVLVKRLVCIEDLGDLDFLVTDKIGTLTNGHITFAAAHDADGNPSEQTLLFGLLASDVDRAADGTPIGGNDLDLALYRAPDAAALTLADYARVAALPFDHDRQRVSVLVDAPAHPDPRRPGRSDADRQRCPGSRPGSLRPQPRPTSAPAPGQAVHPGCPRHRGRHPTGIRTLREPGRSAPSTNTA